MEHVDADKLEQLVDRYGAALVLYARQWCHAPDDALQEALIELLHQVPFPDHPSAWLFKTIKRRALNLARGERRRAEHHRRAGAEREHWFIDEEDAAFEPGEVSHLLQRLPPLSREIVVAKIWGELPFEQIASLVELSTSTVHRRYCQALEILNRECELNERVNERNTRIP